MKSLLLLCVAVLTTVSTVQGYHILCYTPLPSRSHDHLASGIVKPLLAAGHKITWVTAYPKDKPKDVTIIDASQTIKVAEALDIAQHRQDLGFGSVKRFAANITKVAFTEELKTAIIQNQYDAVITEWFFSDIEAGFAAVQGIPWILLSGILMHPHLENLVDQVRSISTVPSLGNNFPIPMNFYERVQNTYSHLHKMLDDWVSYREEEARYESYFKPLAEARGVNLKPYPEAIRDISILLVNAHPSFAPAQSLPPNVVDIGGYHISDEVPPLPKDLQELLDASTQGVVYFSMGSVVKSSVLPQKLQRDLIDILGSIPYTVLWKFEGKLENLPKNVHVRPWMPQASILAHPNVKLFISHCGLLSTLEALNVGVPILALPVFGDQPGNADRGVRDGYAVKVTFGPDMTEEFQAGLEEILGTDRYYKKAKYISKLFRNRPVAPSKLISHYVELAIESKGAHHLRSKTMLYEWYQVWMLDQLAALIAVIVIICLVVKNMLFSDKKRSFKSRRNNDKKMK